MAKLPDPRFYFIPTQTLSGHRAQIFIQEWGPPDGSPLFCVHGLTGSSADFKFVGETLGAQHYRVIAVDMLGRGRSDFVETEDYCYRQYLHDIEFILNHLELPSVDWLGVSMGGLLGIAFAGTNPERVKKMILSDVGPEVPQESLDFISTYLERGPVFTTIEEAVAAFKQSIGTPFDRGIRDEDLWVYYTKTHLRLDKNGQFIRSFDEKIRDKFKSEPLGTDDLWVKWDQIRAPVLALRGEWSLLFPENIAEKMKARKKGAPFACVTIPNCGHVPSLYTEDQIKIIENFLRAQALAGA
jgi:pimeloyl-ACP methyl ester carboxylesterase